jgi:hypothetical protein
MISNAANITKLNKSQKVVKERSKKIVAQTLIGTVPYFG